jgi:glycine/D-amino acid oxidase-like deaminating enzyme
VTTADVVVIGGGANGASTTYQLMKMGVKNVILVERKQLGAGASGKSGALVRMHYTNVPESQLAFESLKIFRDFGDTVGGDSGFDGLGFVQVVPHGVEDRLARNVAAQQALGIETRLITPAELKELQPECYVDDIGAAAYEPHTGFADPNATVYAFAEAARKLGAQIWTNCAATRIVTEGDRVVAVETERGRIDTPAVVLAPGAWASDLLAPLGLDFNLKPHRAQVTVFRWPVGFTRRHFVFIDAVHHSWFRPEGGNGTLIGVESAVHGDDPNNLDEGVDEDYVLRCKEKLSARFPVFKDATMRGGWAGVYMMSPDSRPIIDQLPSVPGLFVMLGDSGTSFKTAPAIGKCLAEWVVNGEPQTVDLTPFRSTRFAEGKPWTDEDSYGADRMTISR